jgi:hypothetical protein
MLQIMFLVYRWKALDEERDRERCMGFGCNVGELSTRREKERGAWALVPWRFGLAVQEVL